jgi:hypothetical protein
MERTDPTHSAEEPQAGPRRGHHAIEVRVEELWELFDEIDPSPFGKRDLDPRADEFIVAWARELPRDEPLRLIVYLGRERGRDDEELKLRDAIHQYFGERVATARRRLRELFRRGRISLAIGLAFLAGAVAVGDLIASYFPDSRIADIFRTGLMIGGWVAMWRPLEIFLYDWWPIRADARLFTRLSAMPVELVYQPSPEPKPAKPDWPEAPAYVPGGRRHPPPDCL